MTKLAKEQIGLQLYTIRNYGQNFEDRLKAAAEVGYRKVELAGTGDHSASEVKALLEQYGLSVCSSHIPIDALKSDLAGQLAFNQALGNAHLIVPWISPESRSSAAQGWLELGQLLAGIAEQAQAAGFKLLYHNHDFEMQVLDGKPALDWLFEGANGKLAAELDLAWVVKGAQDPLDLLKRYQNRCSHVHVKDIAAAGQNSDQDGWADVGHGIMDWAKLLPAAQQAGAQYFIVEHDLPKDPLQTIKRSFDFLMT
jgi:sugar phosphate isomerase/epimerase